MVAFYRVLKDKVASEGSRSKVLEQRRLFVYNNGEVESKRMESIMVAR